MITQKDNSVFYNLSKDDLMLKILPEGTEVHIRKFDNSPAVPINWEEGAYLEVYLESGSNLIATLTFDNVFNVNFGTEHSNAEDLCVFEIDWPENMYFHLFDPFGSKPLQIVGELETSSGGGKG